MVKVRCKFKGRKRQILGDAFYGCKGAERFSVGNQDPPHGSGSGPNMQDFSLFASAMTHRVQYPFVSKFMTERYVLVIYKLLRLLSFDDKIETSPFQGLFRTVTQNSAKRGG